MTVHSKSPVDTHFQAIESHIPHWEKIGDCIAQFIDVMLNYRQSGHPGGSRSKIHAIVSLTLSGAMRWDIRNPEKRFGDKFVLVAGHTIPDHKQLMWKDLMGFRRHGGLAGHAEMEGKTLFLKFNTGPSGHGSPPAAGEAIALKRAGAHGVKVFAIEGEGGLTAGASHETKNSAFGLGLDNLY
jgi:transketolase